jgi:hypothetical protein
MKPVARPATSDEITDGASNRSVSPSDERDGTDSMTSVVLGRTIVSGPALRGTPPEARRGAVGGVDPACPVPAITLEDS